CVTVIEPAAPAPTPTTSSALPSADALPPLLASATVINAIRVDRPPTIDGHLDEEVWSLAQPLTYAEHPPANDSTTVVVRLLWDDAYLYAGFEVSDAHVEGSTATPWDGDTVAVIIDNDGRIQEYRHSLLADGSRSAATAYHLKGQTTFDNAADQDEGYSVEMRIPWATPVAAGDTIAADFWSVDHDQMPGAKYGEEGLIHSKLSWDGDGVDKAGKSVFLYDACFDAKIVSPAGSNDKNTAAGFPVTHTVTISWEPPECVMIVQSYQNNELKRDYRPVTSGTDINIGDPGSGETEIKIWREGFTEQSDNIWVWVE
ncbi:MAG: sugar-binding protein, partial [Anaerolineae bacterium]